MSKSVANMRQAMTRIMPTTPYRQGWLIQACGVAMSLGGFYEPWGVLPNAPMVYGGLLVIAFGWIPAHWLGAVREKRRALAKQKPKRIKA